MQCGGYRFDPLVIARIPGWRGRRTGMLLKRDGRPLIQDVAGQHHRAGGVMRCGREGSCAMGKSVTQIAGANLARRAFLPFERVD